MMKRPKYIKPKRPRPFRLKPIKTPSWLLLYPSKLGMVGGTFFAWILLVVQFIRQFSGTPTLNLHLFVGLAIAFVIGYAATGLFVYYLLIVAERELPEAEEDDYLTTRKKEREQQQQQAMQALAEELSQSAENLPPEETP